MMKTLQESVALLMAKNDYPEKIRKILQLIIDDKLRLPDLEAVLSEINVSRITDLKDRLICILLDYANFCLEDDILTQAEMHDFTTLRRFFRIDEGDFYKCHKEQEVRNILMLQLEKMQSDHTIDSNEALMKNDLQQMFGLSYDQFLEIENIVTKKSLKNGANISDLDTFIKSKK